ncbi:MFS transporter [Blastococcus sp. DSM 46792]|uniref:MFS transporter n=1 Tax=Blastococcus goldschmidtiae TaxID=3075546 RepID=A0ABU2KCV8_9ACTN|nr:MFS transporter [Blastococcus sp. DSM 46792]MDT0278011.1 MFS transporter [Blastococcus sp. DSM 46792]
MSARAAAPRLRHARAAVSAVFFVNAVLYGNLVPRLPEIKDRLDLSNAAFGTAIAAMPAGALLAGLLAPLFIRWFGSARVASLGLLALGLAIAGLPFTDAWIAFAALMLVVGGLDAVVDVAQNAHGFRVQRAYGRSIINGLHALWSIGAVVGGLLGSLAAGLDVPLTAHLTTSAIVFGGVAIVALGFLLGGPEDAERHAPAGGVLEPTAGRRRLGHLVGRTVLLLGVLGALAACEAFVQDAGASWGALYLRGEVGATAAVGGLAFVALQVAMTAGRIVGDRVVDRFGQRRVARVGGAVTAAGMMLALAVPAVGTVLVGFALAGLGVATLVPAVMHTADELPGLPHGVGLTVVGFLLRFGFLVSPTLIGLLADLASLRGALVSVAVAGFVVLLLGRVLVTTATHPADDEQGLLQPGAPAAGPMPTSP